jgi:hypothetical protein
MYDTTTQSLPRGITQLPRRAESWLDDRGRGAWIAAMVMGFIFFWPVGLAILGYMIWSKRMSKHSFPTSRTRLGSSLGGWTGQSSGNSAFDAYRNDTIRRLEEEQGAFEAFLKRLRDAKDKTEFDAFMEERAGKTASDDSRKDVDAY